MAAALRKAIMTSLGNSELITLDGSGEIATPWVEEPTSNGGGQPSLTRKIDEGLHHICPLIYRITSFSDNALF